MKKYIIALVALVITNIAVAQQDANFNKIRRTYTINDDGTINKNGLKSVDDVNASNYLLKPNDIVFARTGASTGKTYFYQL